uniref:Uncharacterized protein n=1 Tax=viral metagenome TaxID=1070528 RepID=A0A6M3KCT6_9ZZZZ
MNYCKVAAKLLKINTVCGVACPIYENCPQLIMEDASDKAIEKAIEAILRSLKNEKEVLR